MNKRGWLIKVFGMLLALAAVIWVMKSLQSPNAAVTDPSSPVGALLGVEPSSTTLPKENIEDVQIRAKVKTGN